MLNEKELESAIFSVKNPYFYPLSEKEFKRIAPTMYDNITEFYLEKRREDSTIIPINKSKLNNRDVYSIINFCANKVNRKNPFKKNYFISGSVLKCGNDINLALNLGVKNSGKLYLVGSLIVVSSKNNPDNVRFLFAGGYTSYKKDIQKMIDGIFS